MPTVDPETNEATLESLRIVRRKLYSIPLTQVDAMSPEDQTKHADTLHNTGLAILKLETAKLKGVNEAFKEKEQDLKDAAGTLENDLAALTDSVDVIRCVSEGLSLVTNVIGLLA